MQIGIKTYDNLLAGDKYITTTEYGIAPSQGDLVRGTIMALLTGGANAGELVPYATGGIDGAGTFYGILAKDELDDASGVASTVIYEAGQFRKDGITIDTGVLADFRDDARLKGVFFTDSTNNTPLPEA